MGGSDRRVNRVKRDLQIYRQTHRTTESECEIRKCTVNIGPLAEGSLRDTIRQTTCWQNYKRFQHLTFQEPVNITGFGEAVVATGHIPQTEHGLNTALLSNLSLIIYLYKYIL